MSGKRKRRSGSKHPRKERKKERKKERTEGMGTYELFASEKAVGHELAGADSAALVVGHGAASSPAQDLGLGKQELSACGVCRRRRRRKKERTKKKKKSERRRRRRKNKTLEFGFTHTERQEMRNCPLSHLGSGFFTRSEEPGFESGYDQKPPSSCCIEKHYLFQRNLA
jgi:hypothetical protein